MENFSSPVLQIDGRRLYYSFLAGTRNILASQAELNRINVFPVSDGDTGSNMAATVRSVFDTVHPHRSFKITMARIADAALSNARGNSGIIFAQFLYGISNETLEQNTVTLHQFADSVRRSVRYIYEAIANPVEGTMLTVIREWADFINSHRNNTGDFNQMMISSGEILARSLEETKGKLDILAKANVVDAGASGFVVFVNGIIDFIRNSNIRQLLQTKAERIVLPDEASHIPEEVHFRYCTEAIIHKVAADTPSLTQMLSRYGDSVVVAGSETMKHLHLHTNDPSAFFDALRKVGHITFQKADDMVRQSDAVYRRKWNIALVTDSTCDLSAQLIDAYQVHVMPVNIHFGDTPYLDKVTLQPAQFYKLVEEGNEFPKTSQINEKAFINLYAHLVSHYDSVIALHLTGQFSGTYFNSQKAARLISEESGKTITVLDSKNLSGGLGLLVLRISRAIEEGLSHERIVEMAGDWIRQTKIFVSVKTLKYMVRGGRVSPLKGWMARMLNIKPIISMDENGKSIVFGKAYSQKSNMEKVIRHIRELADGKKVWNYVVLHANNAAAADWYTAEMKSLTNLEPVSVVDISPVVGANAGIGAASVALMFD
jgi:DegV family protein with EDD domain